MRIGDLIGAPATGVQGEYVGTVVDVRLVQDGPVIAGHRAALRVDGLLVSRRRVLRLFGYERGPGPEGPLLVRWLVRLLHRDIRYLPWGDIAELRPREVLVRTSFDELTRLGDL